MDLVQLKYFQTVARTGNVSKAAEKLFVTQPNLSKSIARLEGELGVPLFDHRKGKITLNEYGRVFLSSVEQAFLELESGRQTVLRMYETDQHVLRLGCCVDDFLPDLLHDFPARYPDVGLRQFSCPYDQVVDRLTDRTADLIITSGPPANDSIRYLEMGRQKYVLLMGAGHPLAGRKGVWLEELREDKFICDISRMNMTRLQELCRRRGFEPNVAYEVESSPLIYRLLELNAGVAFMPIAQVLKIRRSLPGSDRRISMSFIEDDIPDASLGLAFRRDFQFTHAANCLRDYVRDFLEAEISQLDRMERAEGMPRSYTRPE